MKKIFSFFTFVFCFFCLVPNVCAADSAAPTPFKQRADAIAAFFSPQSRGFEKVFSKEFLAKIPPSQLAAVFADYYGNLGPCLGTREMGEPGKIRFLFKDSTVPSTLTLDAKAPYLVVGFWLGNPKPSLGSLDEAVNDLRKLPGKVSFALKRLDQKEENNYIASLNPDEGVAVGSSFKLYLLGTLLGEIESGREKWENLVSLQEKNLSLPSGFLQSWPLGSPFTLHTLAGLMISQSDNTATDHLLALLGRESIEKNLSKMGQAQPERNIPFLSTLEMFKLKGFPAASEKYLSLDRSKKRTYLAKDVARMDRKRIVFPKTPSHVEDIEWFASAADLCRAMDWLRRHSEGGPAAAVRGILSINPGLSFEDKEWSYIGYKGGSEPGVLNMSYLLESPRGEWFALSAGWNDPSSPLQEERFFGMVQRIVELIP